MEELESKLNSSTPIAVAQIFSNIAQNIKEKQKEGSKESLELKFLKDKCISPDHVISDTAATLLINLVQDEILELDSTITDFITMIPLTRCHSSLTKIIGNLLYFEQNRKMEIYKQDNLYNLYLPQHPYIKILIETPDSWKYIFNEIRILYTHQNGDHVTQLFRPVYLYSLANPVQNNLPLLKQKLFFFLLLYSGEKMNAFYDILCWMQVETRNNLETNSDLLIEALNYFSNSQQSPRSLEVMLLWQVSILYNLTLNKLDVRFCIDSLKRIVIKHNSLVTVNCLLLMLIKTIEICSPIYLYDLLILCKELLRYEKNIYIMEALKASLLQWLVCPTILTTQANNIVNSIYSYIENYKQLDVQGDLEAFFKQHETVLNANNIVFESFQTCLLLPYFSSTNSIIEWLDRVKNCSPNLIAKLYHFLCGLFTAKCSNEHILTRVFALILSIVEQNKEKASQLLTLILYKLSNTKDPQLQFVLLKALPKMVVLRNNIPKVMATLQAVSQGSVDMYNFGLSLMFDAWKFEPKCYSYLENMLVSYGTSEKKWETYITKSLILKELCEKKPELYGRDMVAHLSKVLNDCNDIDGALSSSLAIDGIKSLCRAEIIDIVTTWATLWPKFKSDKRILVIKSLCSLISEIPHLPYTESYTELRKEVIRVLWDYISSDDLQVKEAGLTSLTSFSFEEICAQLPERYLDENVIQDRQKAGMGTPQLVPGHIWIKFLSENGASQAACNFVIKLISIEVSNYLKYVYQVKGSREPMNYAYLPTHSIVRGITDYVRTWVNKWKNSVHEILYMECLKILSKEYSKPLPPLDWCFLQELLHETKVKNFCVDIACHQVILSGTARRLVENYIVAVTENPQKTDIMNIMKNLNHLANSIQPMILKPFLETAIGYAINTKEHGENILETIAKYLIEVIQNRCNQETNKTTIAQVLSDQISITNMKSELFDIFQQCIIILPTKCLQEITNVKGEVSIEWFEKVTKLRCAAALITMITPLTWLNDIIDVSSTMKRNLDTRNELISVFRKHGNNGEECALWVLDLIGQIQAKVADRCNEKELVYFFDVFILSVIEFSGYSIFIIDRTIDYDSAAKKLFPQAFNALMNMDHWSVCTNQALEWIYYMNTEETVPYEYRNLFGLTLQGLRHDEEFIKNLRWMKYLSSNVKHEIS